LELLVITKVPEKAPRILGGNPERKRVFGRCRSSWEDNIRKDIKGKGVIIWTGQIGSG
jgi:hypothetical protein